jgi:probable phosphoglycerate mutase
MNPALPMAYLVRHGETAWTLTGQHTGRTDLPLTEPGERQARALGPTLTALHVDHMLSSPLRRARRTAELAMPQARIEADDDLMEWDYGAYEGRRTAEIEAERPGWHMFRDGCPGGETLDSVGIRADRVIGRICARATAPLGRPPRTEI